MIKMPQLGPAFLVTAAFIGPGTVITASLAGANYGVALVWALAFSVIATIILQEMAARLGIVTQQGLGENIRQACRQPLLRAFAIVLVVSAIVIGNGAYQGGNISGAVIGMHSVTQQLGVTVAAPNIVFPLIVAVLAFAFLFSGSYRLIEKLLVGLVALMSIAFIVTFLLTTPDFTALLPALVTPSIPEGATLTVIALIGTTVVPYNLFLHAASASEKWHSPQQLTEARQDLFISIPVGGLISIAIVSTAATAFFGQQVALTSAADLAPALQPVFGELAAIMIGIGLFAAGISSAITAPLAAAFALSGILKLNRDLHSNSFKMIWAVILLIGVLVATSGYKPVTIIWFAQVANGILLPLVTLFLLWIMNTNTLGQYRNNWWQNILAGIVVLVSLLLSGKSLMAAFSLI